MTRNATIATVPLCDIELPAHLHEAASALYDAAWQMTPDQARRVLDIRDDLVRRDGGRGFLPRRAGWRIADTLDYAAARAAWDACHKPGDELIFATWVETACGNLAYCIAARDCIAAARGS